MSILSRYSKWGIVLVIVFCFYYLSSVVPFFGDDLGFAFRYDGLPITSVSDVWDCAIHAYGNHNGRLIPNLLLYFFPSIGGNALFDVLNSLMFFVLIVLILKSIGRAFGVLEVVTAVIGVFLVGYNDNLFFWCAGATNYLWPSVICLGFLLFFQLAAPPTNIVFRAVCLLFGFLAGINHEVYSFPICVGTILYLWFHRKEKTQTFQVLLTIGFVAGSILLISSPGNFSRAGAAGMGDFSILAVGKSFFKLILSSVISVIFLLFCIYRRFRCKGEFGRFARSHALYLIMWVASFVLPILSGAEGRALCATEIFALILLLKYLSFLEISFNTYRKCFWIVASCFAAYFIYVNLANLNHWRQYCKYYNQYLSQEGNVVLVDEVTKFPFTGKYVLDLDYAYRHQFYIERLAFLKYNNPAVRDETLMPIALPSRLNAAIENDDLGEAALDLDGYPVYDNNSLYYVMKYQENLYDRMRTGFLFRENRNRWLSFALKYNYLVDEIKVERPVLVLPTAKGKYILISKEFKDFAGLSLEKFGFNEDHNLPKYQVIR